MKLLLTSLIFILNISVQPVNSQDNNLELLSKWFAGRYNTTEQSKADSLIIDLHLQVEQIDLINQTGNWFYLETSFSENKSSPYKQEIYNFHTSKIGFINLDRYTFLKPEDFIGIINNDSLLNSITREQLKIKNKCSLYINKINDIFIGLSSGKLCASKIRNATYSKTDIEITQKDFFLWERGYNSRNEQAWGTTHTGLIFTKIIKKK